MITRLLRTLLSGLALLLVLAGLPAGLVVVQRAAQWDWRQLVVDPLSEGGVVVAVLAAGWLLWLALLWMVVLDAVDAVRQVGRAPRLPVPLHAAVTALVSGILLAVEAARGGGAGGPADQHAHTSSVVAPLAADDVRDARGAVSGGGERFASRSALTVMGVDVPGGWLPVPVTAAITAAATLLWAQRRRQYLPQPPRGWRRDDEDLTPLPAAVDRIARLTHAAMDADADRAAMTSGDDGGSVPDAAMVWDVEAVLPAAGVALAGPGALDAVRGLLVAVTIGPAAGAKVLVPQRLWSPLLGADTAAGASGRVQVVTDDAQWPVLSAPNGSGAATIVVLADAATTSRPAIPAHLAAAWDGATVRTVMIGAASGVHTWHVAGDGRLHPVAGPAPVVGRLPVLNLPTARTLLGALGIVTATAGNLEAPVAGSAQPPQRHHLHRTVPASWSADTSAGRPPRGLADPPQLPLWPDPPPEEGGQPRRLLVRVLGILTVLTPHPDGSHSTVQIRRSAGQQILVLLVVHRAGLSAANLKEAIWPDTRSKAAHRSFLTTISQLRRTLHDAASRPVLLQRKQNDDPDETSYRLDPSTVQTDLWRLQTLLDAAAATTDPIHRHELLNHAAAVPGELAQGWDHEWLTAAREHVTRHQIDVLTHLADVEPDPPTRLRLLRQAQHVSPTNDAVHSQLMALHAAAGDTTAMRRAAATHTEHLAEHHLTQDPTTVHLLDTPPPTHPAPHDPSASMRN